MASGDWLKGIWDRATGKRPEPVQARPEPRQDVTRSAPAPEKRGYQYQPVEKGSPNPAGRMIHSHTAELRKPGTRPPDPIEVVPTKLELTRNRQRGPSPGGEGGGVRYVARKTFTQQQPAKHSARPEKEVKIAPLTPEAAGRKPSDYQRGKPSPERTTGQPGSPSRPGANLSDYSRGRGSDGKGLSR